MPKQGGTLEVTRSAPEHHLKLAAKQGDAAHEQGRLSKQPAAARQHGSVAAWQRSALAA